jgi:hypothetical protein
MSWLHRILGKDGVSQGGVEPGGGSFRSSQRPWEYASNGHYRLSVPTGTLAAALAANAVVFSARWSHATKLAVITSLKTRFLPLTLFTATTLDSHTSFDAYMNTSFTAAHTGGTAITLTGTALKTRQSMAATQFADIRIATTAALGGGTVTATAHPFAATIRKGNRVNPAAATEETIQPTTDGMDLDFEVSNGGHPLILSQDTGITVRNRTVWPAAGTGILLVTMAWAEVDAFA